MDISTEELQEQEPLPIKDKPKEDEFEDSLLDLENTPSNFITKTLDIIALKSLINLLSSNKKFKLGILVILFCLYNAYLITAIAYHIRNSTDFRPCTGVGLLIIITSLAYLGLIYFHIAKPFLKPRLQATLIPWWTTTISPFLSTTLFQILASLTVLAAIIIFVIIDTKDDRRRLISFSGLLFLVLLGVVLSKHPGRIVWRHVLWGLGLQFIFGLFVLRWSVGKEILECISNKVTTFLDFTLAGSSFVYGYLATGSVEAKFNGQPGVLEVGGVFIFSVLSIIYFISFVVSILYHYGVMMWIVAKMGWLLEITVGTTAAESMNAAANIFLGQTEAPLVVKPFLGKMTKSEIHAVMTGGFASVSGSVLGAYISFGVDAFHLLSASLMSAPAALAFAKILYPETKQSITNSKQIYNLKPKKSGNALDAGAKGASQGVFLVANIAASLVAITAGVAMLNAVVNWCAVLVGQNEITFQWIVEKLFYPLAFLLGVDNEELDDVALLLGEKTVINEFVAYAHMTSGMCLSPRSKAIATYALCCFANFSSIGITLGALTAMNPERAKDLAAVVFSAFIGGNAAALLTACVAGTLISEDGYDIYSKSTSYAECLGNLTTPLSSNIFKYV